MSEQSKFEQWFEEQKNDGLIDFKVTLNPSVIGSNMPIETIFKELNAMNDAIARGDYTVPVEL